MSNFTVLAGDFPEGNLHNFTQTAFLFKSEVDYVTDIIRASEINTLEVASEETVKKAFGTIGWGVAGAALLGPLGMLAGILLGGKKKYVTFVCVFKDGRKFIGTCTPKVYTEIMSGTF